jgi:hypothetical protein
MNEIHGMQERRKVIHQRFGGCEVSRIVQTGEAEMLRFGKPPAAQIKLPFTGGDGGPLCQNVEAFRHDATTWP